MYIMFNKRVTRRHALCSSSGMDPVNMYLVLRRPTASIAEALFYSIHAHVQPNRSQVRIPAAFCMISYDDIFNDAPPSRPRC